MLSWISQHSDTLGVLANLGMLAVWVLYAQLLLNSVIKQRRPRVLINEGKGRDLDAEIIIANMSDEKIYIQLLIALVDTDENKFTHTITDVYVYDDDNNDQVSERTTSQGPLGAGQDMHLGTFRRVMQQVSPGVTERQPWRALEIRLVFFYGSKSTPIAATRTFHFEERDNGKRFISPAHLDTTVLHRPWHRRRIQH